MARLSNDELKKLKSEISLLRLIESQGHSPKPQGKDFVIHCPFHQDKTPSLMISTKKNVFNCFGCGESGTVIDWVMKTQSVSFIHAVELLKQDAGLASKESIGVKRSYKRHLPSLIAENAEQQDALKRVVDYYHQQLKSHQAALAYLTKRGLNHPELIDEFKLGFADKTLTYRLPATHTKAGKAIRTQLKQIGILRNKGQEHFNGSIVMPIINQQGIIQEIYGRKITPKNKMRKGSPVHLYLPGEHKGIWNIKALQASEEIILCEAIIDAMTFWVHGFRNVTTSYGTQGFTKELLAAFKQHNIKRVLIAYDRDQSGNNAVEQVAKQLIDNGIDAYRILFPMGMDVNSYAMSCATTHPCGDIPASPSMVSRSQGEAVLRREPAHPKGMDVNEYALQVTPANKSLSLVIRKAQLLGDPQEGNHQKRLLDKKLPGTESNELEKPFSLASQTLASNITEVEESKLTELLPEPLSEPTEQLPEPTQASPQPKANPSIPATVNDQEIKITLGNRNYRIRGLSKNLSYEHLKVNILVTHKEYLHIDSFDLYQSRPRQAFINQASGELGVTDKVIKTDLGKVLLKLEELQDKQIKTTLEPEKPSYQLNNSEQQQALELLKDKNLLTRILKDFKTAGVVGEETNKLVGYLACVSRKLDKPLAVIIQSSSAAGKSSLMDAILKLMPEEERVQYSAMTGQSLFYMGETNLKHKILAIAEEEGAENASYALKLLQSEGELTIASTGKDESSGTMTTREYRVQGPVMLFLTTTAIDIDEELMNRCIVLTVNESRAQTQAIHAMQRKQQTLSGLLQDQDKKHITQLHRNAQRLLKPLLVANPYAEQLTFIDDKTRTRRDHMKYLSLIKAIALLHQYQREIKTVNHHNKLLKYIEVIPKDIEIANQLAHEVLGRSLDELPPQSRKLLKHIHDMVEESRTTQGMEQRDYRFSRRDIREYTGWSDGQLKIHCSRLTELEYLLVHRGGRGHSLVYELLYDGDINKHKNHLMGLINTEILEGEGKKLGANNDKSPSSQGQVSARSGPSQGNKNGANPDITRPTEESITKPAKKGNKGVSDHRLVHHLQHLTIKESQHKIQHNGQHKTQQELPAATAGV